MSKMPECKSCGNYIHHGYVLCEKCSERDNDTIISLTKQIQQLEAYNKKLLTENTKYASESDELVAQNERLRELLKEIHELLSLKYYDIDQRIQLILDNIEKALEE